MNLSICIITKNEEQNIDRCLKALAPYGLETIVVDTGSTDRTKQIAARYTDRLYDFPWCDDFSAAKNFAIEKASHSYVLVLDSDEFVEQLDLSALEKQIAAHPGAVGRIRRRNVFHRNGEEQENREWINRIFAKEYFHYEGRIHEQVTPLRGAESGYRTYETPVVILHTGYDLPEQQKKEKAERNIRLLEQELKQLGWDGNAGAKDGVAKAETAGTDANARWSGQIPYLLYQLGKSYYMMGEYGAACGWFAQGLSFDLNPALEYVIDMVETYGYALINSGQEQTALFFENIYDEFGKSADFQFLMGLIYMKNARFTEAVREFEKAAGHAECRAQGVNSYRADYNIGVIYECLGKKEEALAYYRKCGGYAPAEEQDTRAGAGGRRKSYDNERRSIGIWNVISGCLCGYTVSRSKLGAGAFPEK